MFTKKEKEMLYKCIDTRISFICHNIASRATMKVSNQDYRDYLDNLTKEDMIYLKELEKLQEKVVKEK